MFLGDNVAAVFLGVVVGLLDYVADLGELGAQLLLVRREPAAVLDDGSNTHEIKMLEAFLVAEGAHELGVLLDILLVPVHGGVELGLHLEDLLELGVQLVQHVVDLGVSDEDYLGVEGYGLGPQAPRGHEPHPLGQLLYLQLLVYYGPLQGLVAPRVAGQFLHRDDEIPAVGLMGAPRPDHGVVGDEGPEPGLLLRSTEDTVMAWVHLDDDRRPLQLAVVHYEVDLIPLGGVRRLTHQERERRLRLLLRPGYLIQVSEDVIPDGVEILVTILDAAVLVLEGLQEVLHGVVGHLLVEGVDSGLGLPIDFPELPERTLKVFLKPFPIRPNFVLDLLWQYGELLLVYKLPVDHRDYKHPYLASLERKIGLQGLLVELLH